MDRCNWVGRDHNMRVVVQDGEVVRENRPKHGLDLGLKFCVWDGSDDNYKERMMEAHVYDILSLGDHIFSEAVLLLELDPGRFDLVSAHTKMSLAVKYMMRDFSRCSWSDLLIKVDIDPHTYEIASIGHVYNHLKKKKKKKNHQQWFRLWPGIDNNNNNSYESCASCNKELTGGTKMTMMMPCSHTLDNQYYSYIFRRWIIDDDDHTYSDTNNNKQLSISDDRKLLNYKIVDRYNPGFVLPPEGRRDHGLSFIFIFYLQAADHKKLMVEVDALELLSSGHHILVECLHMLLGMDSLINVNSWEVKEMLNAAIVIIMEIESYALSKITFWVYFDLIGNNKVVENMSIFSIRHDGNMEKYYEVRKTENGLLQNYGNTEN